MNYSAYLSINNIFNSLFLVILVVTIQGCSPDSPNKIPFIEAEGYVDTYGGDAVVSWLSPDKVIYGGNSTEKANSYSEVNELDFESSKQVNILDIATQKTSLYRKGQLLMYKNDKILIRLATAGYEPQNNHHTSKSNSKSKYLYGNLGSEIQEEYDETNKRPFQYLPPLHKCPSDNTNGESYNAWFLISEQACLRIPDDNGKDRRWIYYQSNGQTHELTTSSGIFTPDFKWISWIEAYVIENRFPSVETTAKVRVLYTNGKFELLNISQAVQHAKPTKAGVIGAINNKGAIDGLRLFHEDSVLQITKGTVRLTEVSPDGCKVAYVTNQKLRVVDVCSIFRH